MFATSVQIKLALVMSASSGSGTKMINAHHITFLNLINTVYKFLPVEVLLISTHTCKNQ